MGIVTHRLHAYIREAQFAAKSTCNWPSFYALLHNTARFHLRNMLGMNVGPSGVFTVDLRLSEGYTAAVTLRALSGDIFVLHEVLTFACYRIPNWRIAPETVRTVIDAGANIGITSLYFAARYPQARIYSVEPLPENFALLEANVANEPRIKPINGCVTGVSNGTVQFTTDGPTWGNRIGNSGITVPAFTIGELCRKEDLEKVDLLKIDIEGAEKEVLANADFFDRVRNLIIELHNDYDFESFQSDVDAFDFQAYPPCPPEIHMFTASKRSRR
jgi:FkbM family methyltransferase